MNRFTSPDSLKFRNISSVVAGSHIAELLYMPQQTQTQPQSDDRRDVALREALLARLRREIRHVPGLALTTDQASRLFDVPPDLCARLLESLAQQGVIYVRPDGRFIARPADYR
jgi:hypothetical protein